MQYGSSLSKMESPGKRCELTEARTRENISKQRQLPFPLAEAAANQEATKRQNLPSGLGGLRRAAQSESQPLAATILVSMLHKPL